MVFMLAVAGVTLLSPRNTSFMFPLRWLLGHTCSVSMCERKALQKVLSLLCVVPGSLCVHDVKKNVQLKH